MGDIKQRISLDGAEDVAAKLRKIGDTGSDAFKKLQQYSGKSLDSFSAHTESVEGSHEAGERLREVIHTLHPVLEEAGLGLGNLGQFARLAGSSIAALGVAIAGSLLVGLAKIGDETQKAKSRLAALGDDRGFEKLSDRAKALGVTVDSLQPRYEKFITQSQRINAQNRSVMFAPGFKPGENETSAAGVRVLNGGQSITPPSQETFGKFDKALFEEIRVDVKDAETAAQLADEFEQGIAKSGLTGDVLRSLQDKSPHAANFVTGSLSSFLGRGFSNPNELAELLDRGVGSAPPPGLSAEQRRVYFSTHSSLTGVGANDLISEVAKHAPEADREAQAARGVTESFEALEASTHRLAEAMSGDLGLAKIIDRIAHLIDEAAENFDRKVAHPRDYEPGGPKFIGPVSPAESAQYNTPDILDVGKALFTGNADERFKDSNAINVAKGLFNFNPLEYGATPNPEKLLENKSASPAPGELINNPLQQPNLLGRKNPFDQPVPPPPGTEREGGGFLINRPELQAEQHSELQGLPAELGAVFKESTADASQSTKEQTGVLQQILSAIAAFVQKQTDTVQTGPVATTGVRGADGGYVALAPGGHVRGAGTSTSDSVPAMLSDGEYVVKASSVQKAGLGFMDWLNAGKFADGGEIDVSSLSGGSHQITFDPTTGGAIIDGNVHRPGDPILDDPNVKAALSRSKAGINQPEPKRKHKSDFVGIFGGHVFDEPGSYADGGLIGHFAGGGFAGGFDVSSMAVSAPGFLGGSANQLGDVSSIEASISAGLHPVTLQMPGGNSISGLLAPGNIVDAIKREAVMDTTTRTAPRPSWWNGN